MVTFSVARHPPDSGLHDLTDTHDLWIGAHRGVGFEVGLAEWAKEESFGL
jgi:hypothetical protein